MFNNNDNISNNNRKKFKSVIIPYVRYKTRIYLMLGKAAIGNYGYLGGTQEPGENVAQTAAREFWEETKMIVPIDAIEKQLCKAEILLSKNYKNTRYYFFVIPWCFDVQPIDFIRMWRLRQVEGDVFNEKKDIRLVEINDKHLMTLTVRMVLNRIKQAIYYYNE